MKAQLIKTIIKGLYLTVDGKAWHKSAKRELTPTKNGKIRFNGKLYDLQKLSIAPEKKIVPKPKLKKGFLIADLKKQGFKKTTLKGLYLTNNGKCYNTVTKRTLSATAKGNIILNNKSFSLPKLILQTFKKEAIKSGKIIFKNGNNSDFHFENLEYKKNFVSVPAPVESDLIQCIRLYFSIEKGFNRNSMLYKFYLYEVIKIRGFNNVDPNFILFSEWVLPFYTGASQSKQSISKKHGFKILQGTNIINDYLLQFINECMQDLQKGNLQVKEFLPKPPHKKSIAQILNDFKKSFAHLKNSKNK